jgi:GAF domain-containing protein
MNASFSLVTELERLANALSADGRESAPISLQSVAERIAKSLGVKPNEVAILGLSTRWKHLHFLAPEALQHVGYIPLSSNSALAARTARESRPEINNNFSAVRHASVFEGVKVGGEASEAIQKIISAPILSEGKVVGIIQISRKGANTATAGADFTASDLGQVLALCKPLGKLLRHVTREKS